MKKMQLIWAFLSISWYATAQEYSYKTLTVGFEENKTEASYTFKNLRLYPIRAKAGFLPTERQAGKYLLLRQAIEQQKIVISENSTGQRTNDLRPNTRTSITEPTTTPAPIQMAIEPPQVQTNDRGGAGEVNLLHFENVSKDTIYVMAGEVIQGGKQDRVVAQDMLLLPESGKVGVSVFCVEQGRWRFDDKKSDKNFNEYYGISSLNMRKKVEKERNQQAVWSEVRRSNNENNVQTTTDAYTAQKDNLYLKQNTTLYKDFFNKAFEKETEAIGVLVVTGDKVVGCDLFASPALFKGQFSNLLSSYIAEALTDGAAVNIKPAAVKEYADNLLGDAEKQRAFITQKGNSFEYQNKLLRISTFK